MHKHIIYSDYVWYIVAGPLQYNFCPQVRNFYIVVTTVSNLEFKLIEDNNLTY